MREMKQGNVCAFIGAYVHAEHVTLVTEYCTRGEYGGGSGNALEGGYKEIIDSRIKKTYLLKEINV